MLLLARSRSILIAICVLLMLKWQYAGIYIYVAYLLLLLEHHTFGSSYRTYIPFIHVPATLISYLPFHPLGTAGDYHRSLWFDITSN